MKQSILNFFGLYTRNQVVSIQSTIKDKCARNWMFCKGNDQDHLNAILKSELIIKPKK